MSLPRPRLLLLLLAVPLLVGMTVLVYRGTGDEPVSDRDDRPPAPPASEVMGTVAGTVTGGDGEPVTGAAVLPTSIDQPAQPVPEIGVTTGAAGRYEWRLHPGRYEFGVFLDGEARGTRTVTVTAGQTSTLDFVLTG